MHYIFERREEHTSVANTHVEDLCVRGVAVLLNDMAKLTLSDANLTVLTAFVRKRHVANVCLGNDLRTHALHWYVPPSLSCTCTLTSHDSPESSRRLARRTHRLSVGRRHTHTCSSHPTLKTSKNKRRHIPFILTHTSHTYTITLVVNVLWA